ncbi:MAG TPA: glycosyltransferase, partial [Chthoniobacterales bacterium]
MRSVRARIGAKIFPGISDRERPDVMQTLGLPETTEHMSFKIDARIPFGKNNLLIEVAGTDNRWHQVFSHKVRGPLLSGAADREQWRDVELNEAKRRYISALDVPQPWNPPPGTVHISGWCVDTEGEKIEAVRARVQNRTYRAIFGVPRADLVQDHPAIPSSARAVFGIGLRVPRNARHLSLELKQANGRWREFCRRKISREALVSPRKDVPRGIDFQAGTKERSRFEFWFDRPADWSKRRRYLHISGWCFAGEGPKVEALRARIGREIFPARYGIVRPDVAARLQGLSGAFGSGFFVDVIVPRNNRKLILEAKSENGKWEQFYSRRIKGPIFAPRYDDVQEKIGNYSSWIRAYDTLSRADRRQIRMHISRLSRRPLISVLLPAFNTDAQLLKRAIQSVQAQLYANWELCIVDDGSTAPHVWPLITRYGHSDRRIKTRRLDSTQHISAATNAALELATGEFVAFLDHDDELAETALYFAAVELDRNPGLKYIYSDEDKLDIEGRRCDPHFKTDWNPDLFLAQNFVSHLSV